MRSAKTKKIPVATAAYLERSGLRYLERFAASSDKVRKLLMRKVSQSAEAHGTSAAEGAQAVDRLVQRFVELGLIRDRDLALARAERLHQKGSSKRMIQAKLGAMGLGQDDIAAALREVDERTEGDSELEAAWSLARRKKLGPYRPAAGRDEHRNRDMGVMARAGFSFATARRVLDSDSPPDR